MKKLLVLLTTLICVLPINTLALSLSCQSCIIMDTESGRILYEKNINNQRLIASITKIMTAILAIESGKLEETVTVGEEVLTMYGSNIYIELGEKMKLIDLVYGLMLRSGNDAAVVIAKYVGETEERFVEMMNKKAQEIGMKNTIYNNPHGLDENTQNKSTAYDMALLSSYAIKNDIYKKIVSTKKYQVTTNKKSYIWYNRNQLLNKYEYAIGGKTGYTPNAGKTLVTNALQNNLNLTSVTLNDGNQYDSHIAMYNYAFKNYKKYKILDKNKFKIDDNFYKEKIYIKNNFYYPLRDYEIDQIKVLVKITKLNNISNNDEVGTVTILLNNEKIYEDKVYVSTNRKKEKLINKIINWFKNKLKI